MAAAGQLTGVPRAEKLHEALQTLPPNLVFPSYEPEVAEIVRGVQFGWFDAIYRNDQQALSDFVAVPGSFDRGVELMGDNSFFIAEPEMESIVVEIRKILIDREDCLAVSYYGDSTAFRGEGAEGEAIMALWPRPADGRWRSAYRGDVWEAACNEFTRENQLP